MNLWPFTRRTVSDSARELALIGHEKRRERIKAVARKLREECGLESDARLA